ncbi:MAG: ATP synthase F1 subunit epsilon, partial [Methylococcales bacterium]
MTMTIHVDIVSAESEIFSGLAEMVFAPAEMGEVGIAPRHAPLITNLVAGEVRLKISDKEMQEYYVSGGILEV